MSDETKKTFSQEEIYKILLTDSIRIEAKLDALLHSQAFLVAKADGTDTEDEMKVLSDTVDKRIEALTNSLFEKPTTPEQ